METVVFFKNNCLPVKKVKMFFDNIDIRAKVAVVLVGLGVLFDIIGLAIPYWRYLSIDAGTDVSDHMGLWKECVKTVLFQECFSYDSFGISA